MPESIKIEQPELGLKNMVKKSEFSSIEFDNWGDFIKKAHSFTSSWFFRGQRKDWKLISSLERACHQFNISPNEFPNLENFLIREFRRSYRGDNIQDVRTDTLYCIALMQHYGSPTRLLDFSYSIYVAAFFALEFSEIGSKIVIWCIDGDWLNRILFSKSHNLKKRSEEDPKRNDKTFREFYLSQKYNFVMAENPFIKNDRLIAQQGVFLCPANLSLSFEENLKAVDVWYKPENILKIYLNVTEDLQEDAFLDLKRMNINRSTLFPGLEGFAQSLRSSLIFYHCLGKRKEENDLLYKNLK